MGAQAAAAAAEPPVARAAWGALAVLCLFYVLNNLDRTLLSLVVRPVKRDLGINDFQMSLLLGLSYALFYGVCAVPFGWLVDRLVKRALLAQVKRSGRFVLARP
jgi:MFS family permease